MKKKITMLVLVALIFSCLFSCFSNLSVYASSISVDGGYTSVLEDLAQDENFNAEDYPVIANDYSLQVITIAESSDKELFVYVYQPCSNFRKLVASYITISNAFHNADYIKLYKLTLLNYEGVFYKYIVNGFSISEDDTRYYDIIDILRPYDSEIDADSGTNNIITNVTYKVAKQFTIGIQDGKNMISVTGTDIVEITDKYVGFVRYKDNNAPSWINKDSCDNHFVAFSTDKDIDRLFEADVYYTHQSYHYHYELLNVYTTYGEIDDDGDADNYSYLNYTEKHSYTGSSGLVWGKNTYDWQEISSGKNFITDEIRDIVYENSIFNSKVETKLTDEGKANIQNKDWVLCFAQTDYDYDEHYTSAGALINEYKTIIGDVKILRLKFETDSVTYNLGVVDNMQSGDQIPDNETNITWSLSELFKILMTILLLILIVIVLGPVLPTIISIVLWVIKTALKVVLWIISLPFKIFGKRE